MTTFFIFLFGLIIGSFLNVIVFRLHNGMSLVWSRSKCLSCGHNLSFFDLIPLLSFLFLSGQCRYCHKKISWQYPLLEFATGILFVLIFYKYANLITLWHIKRAFGLSARTNVPMFLLPFRDAFFVSTLLVIFVSDLKYYLILDRFVLPAIIFSFCFNLVLAVSPEKMLISAILLALFFAVQFFLSRGRWVGGGDIRLAFLIGIMIPGVHSADTLFASYVIGAIVSIFLLVVKLKDWKSPVPFGTFLSGTAIYNILFGTIFLEWYLHLLS